MMEFLPRLLELIFIVWVVRFLLRSLLGTAANRRPAGFDPRAQQYANHNPEPRVVSGGEMKKDPQCGTYVSTELSFKSRSGSDTLHFCSRECQQQYLQAHTKPA